MSRKYGTREILYYTTYVCLMRSLFNTMCFKQLHVVILEYLYSVYIQISVSESCIIYLIRISCTSNHLPMLLLYVVDLSMLNVTYTNNCLF